MSGDGSTPEEEWDEAAWEADCERRRAEDRRRQNAAAWLRRFGTPDCVGNYHFYAYEYLDDLSFMRPAREVFGGWEHAETLIQAVEQRFKQIGWEGDGLMQILWLPPFAGAGGHDNYGCYVLHVKQDNDGISWLASPVPLPFHRLFRRDTAQYPDPKGEDVPTRVERQGSVHWLHDLFPGQDEMTSPDAEPLSWPTDLN